MQKYNLQKTTIWRFTNRGHWATHKGDYRGNWSPHIPRNLILKYTKPHDTVLDCFIGSGTTLIETKLLNRNGIGIDINANAIDIAKKRTQFSINNSANIKLFLGDAQNLNMIKNNSIDFICTHPPYANIIKYSDNLINDLSILNHTEFLKGMKKVSKELYRVLKPSRKCSFMIGDIRKDGNVIPLGFLTMQCFIENNFKLKEIIIKEQHNCTSTPFWLEKIDKMNFYLLAHEYIFVFVK